jgi:hypothetical protein
MGDVALQITLTIFGFLFVIVQGLVAYIAYSMRSEIKDLSVGFLKLGNDIHTLAITATEHKAEIGHVKSDIRELKETVKGRPCLTGKGC